MGSADLMPRNLDRRVEVLVPLRSPELIRKVKNEILEIYLKDNVKARRMSADGIYKRAPQRGKLFNAQTWLLSHNQTQSGG